MALSNRKTIWSAQVLVALRRRVVFGSPAVTNRNFQGEIRQGGDRVKVTGVVTPTIFDVASNADIPAPETLTDEAAELVIDQSKGFNFQVDDLDRIQVVGGQGLVVQSAQNAAQELALVADAHIAGKMIANVDPDNEVGSVADPIEVNQPAQGVAMPAGHADVKRVLTRLSVKLDDANVPEDGRWAILPGWMAGLLSEDPRLLPINDGLARTGRLGELAGFTLYKSSAAPRADGPAAGVDTDVFRVVAGHSMATAYAEQLVETKFYEPEARFAQAAKGRHVYGSKVFYPKALAVAHVIDESGIAE